MNHWWRQLWEGAGGRRHSERATLPPAEAHGLSDAAADESADTIDTLLAWLLRTGAPRAVASGGSRRRHGSRPRYVALDAAVDEADRATRVGCHVGLVRDHQHGDAALLVQVAQQVHDLTAALRVEVAGRLVGQQDGGPGRDRTRDGRALLLAAR